VPRPIQINVEPLPNLDEEVKILSLKCKDMVSFVNDTRLGLFDDHLIILYSMIRSMSNKIGHEIHNGPKIENILKLKNEYNRLEYWLLEKRNLSSS
jgi:hypothetical protein